ncbi:MAG: 4Fe-4S dicluster domain-containing protein [Chloroflexi bacterium]|nr:4Fe-4S dicluster domain-containing protein [Chloroflexota bacterium]
MQIDLRILRYDPERDAKPHWQSYAVEADPRADRVLDLLHRVKYEHDGSLTFRRSCAHGICGSVNEAPAPQRERLQSVEERARYDDTTKCILCAACTTSCPSFWSKEAYVGPAAIVNAHRFIFDSRDEGGDERLEILAGDDGVWRCRTIFNCTDACPRGIHITQAILEVSAAIVERRQ